MLASNYRVAEGVKEKLALLHCHKSPTGGPHMLEAYEEQNMFVTKWQWRM